METLIYLCPGKPKHLLTMISSKDPLEAGYFPKWPSS